jgi:hypothetical protein
MDNGETSYSSYACPGFKNKVNFLISSGCLITMVTCVSRRERREDILRHRGKLWIAYEGTVLKQFFRVPRSCFKNAACYVSVKKLDLGENLWYCPSDRKIYDIGLLQDRIK